LEWTPVDQSPEQSKTEWLCTDVAGYNTIKHIQTFDQELTLMSILMFPRHSLYAGNFMPGVIAHFLTVGAWPAANIFELLHNPKEAASSF